MRGNIRRRGANSWQLTIEMQRSTDGRRKQLTHTVHGTKKDAETKLRELITATERGDYVAPTKETVGRFLERWLDTYAGTNTSPRTQRDYRGKIYLYLLPAFRTLPLTALRPEHVQGLYADLLERGLSRRTVLHTHRILKEALAHAVKWRFLARNVCDAVDAPRPDRKEMVALDTNGVVRLLSAAKKSKYRDVFLTALYTGLRRSEVLALRWPDVDLDRGVIRVVAGLHRLSGNGLVLLPVKTARSRRQVTITQEVVDVLRGIRGSQVVAKMELGPVWRDTGFLFTKPDGGPLDPEKVTHAFTSVLLCGLSALAVYGCMTSVIPTPPSCSKQGFIPR